MVCCIYNCYPFFAYTYHKSAMFTRHNREIMYIIMNEEIYSSIMNAIYIYTYTYIYNADSVIICHQCFPNSTTIIAISREAVCCVPPLVTEDQ